ncbi:hypothetical protein [Janthinobacterium sp. SUN137]|uniref:hypothetical protein n=1 Tax=Janthinobacterium sp. SUN137 TaxID=3014789 RepID=UPI00271312BD|nr:hypothetical protein [Janthinobacterium sp. SUN137]MDO8040278.1 hypothetical protein [Janthinobacterium sp. SUN137]
MLKINWSVWDNNSTVSWDFNANSIRVEIKMPPLGVANLKSKSLIAIVGRFDEFGSSNLLLYSYEGILQRAFKAPPLGKCSQFTSVSESNGIVSVGIGFETDSDWGEKSAHFNVIDGTLTNYHRSY